MNVPKFPESFVEPWLKRLQACQEGQIHDFPNYYVHDPKCLITSSAPRKLHLGTGHAIFKNAIIPAVLSAKHSIHFVTCFWAPSPALDMLKASLEEIARARIDAGSTKHESLHVTIGFSSYSLLQKLFHTCSKEGHSHLPNKWEKLGLPSQATLEQAGITMTVKSLFFTPFSVMHPKYVIIDETRALLPSCNVSWEAWFEGCIEVRGSLVQQLLLFHQYVWGKSGVRAEEARMSAAVAGAERRDGDSTADDGAQRLRPDQALAENARTHEHETEDELSVPLFRNSDSDRPVLAKNLDYAPSIPTIFLPSPHHRNPKFTWFGLFPEKPPPMTPLNAALITLFENAQRNIVMITPNLTSRPVMDGIVEALIRGVDVTIRTSKGLMTMEQIVTAGTTTVQCMRKLTSRYGEISKENEHRYHDHDGWDDVERQPVKLGNLRIFYYKLPDSRKNEPDEPVQSHFKMTLVDNEYLVLGSGNMDRASWWTSQELGVLFHVPGFSGNDLWDPILQPRSELVFSSFPGGQH